MATVVHWIATAPSSASAVAFVLARCVDRDPDVLAQQRGGLA
jgi:hypothetical protein